MYALPDLVSVNCGQSCGTLRKSLSKTTIGTDVEIGFNLDS